MADIFISYASANRESAQLLANALEDEGWSVWWDRTILPGKIFDKVIEQALDEAKATMVLWSSASVASDWVREEIADAARKGTLVPVLIEEVAIPLGFRRFQAASLFEWDADRNDPEFQKLLTALVGVTGKSHTTDQKGNSEKPTLKASETFATKNKWHADIIRRTNRLFHIKIFLSKETHFLEWRSVLSKESTSSKSIAKLDGNPLAVTSLGLMTEVYHFDIPDDTDIYHAEFSASGVFNLTYKLIVDNIPLYNDRE